MSAVHRVELRWRDGRTETIAVRGDETVLDAAGREGVSLPFGCLTGACATCAGQLLAGRVEHRRPPRALKERHLADGYVLLCVAEPRTDCRLRVGSDVQAELVSNPWR
ncbi:2Fe-2S iron-sulfur cluster-binding protein [Halegenticoccus soli]|uniref:2Fe-2S iron-sulfur cluster-binding protein n=1 Tax=Halegenticoccus soli TaxID=1985678 RepID=UPI000C6E4156|nr:2Fe-2S iron-sulfur cluster-binding protein [Halegenticoccus soli]